jgi:hypothetical protein
LVSLRLRLRASALLGAAVVISSAVACSVVLGIGDRKLDPGEGPSPEAGGASDATLSEDSTNAQETGQVDEAANGDDGADAGSTPDAMTADARDDAQQNDGSPLVDTGGCGDPMSDPHNCGGCGHDCLGGRCSSGACQPVALIDAGGGVSPFWLAQDDQYLYWTDRLNGTVNRTGKSSVGTTRLWQACIGRCFPEPIAVDDAGVYWGDFNGVWRCPKGGCPISPTFVAATPSNVHGLAVDDNNVYWSDDTAQLVLSAPKNGLDAGATTLWYSDAAVPYEVKTDGRNVYFGGSDSLLHVVSVDGGSAADGGSIAIGIPGTEASLGVALQGGFVYWTVTNFTNAGQGPVWSASTTSLTPFQIVLNQVLPGPIASDGTSVFWLDFTFTSNGDLRTCTIVGCTSPSVRATGIMLPRAVVVDDTAVYWTDEGNGAGTLGSLWKLAK